MGNPLVARMQGFGTTIFAEMSALALSTGAINLGQGYPTPTVHARCSTPPWTRSARAATSTLRGPVCPELLAAVAEHQRRFYGLSVDPAREVLVTAGATEAIAAVDAGPVRAR
jgi:N-succinyldiaminopimelate aminotransferase